MITVFADRYLYQITSFLPEAIDLKFYDPAQGLPKQLPEADALLIRTVNAINPQTQPEIPAKLSFIGTGSSGTDHVDQHYLQEQGITFADAAGCNARSVAEYVAAGLLLWSEQVDHPLQDVSIGIAGVGHAGSQVNNLLQELEFPTICYDPPRGERDPSFRSSSLEEVLACDILTFHTPLTTDGRHPTYHWLDDKKLSDHDFQLIINSARGGVVDEQTLLKAYQQEKVGNFILDVWDGEPEISLRTAEKALLKTPHIAGYSIQAKQNASKFIAEALIDHFGLPPAATGKTDAFRMIKEPVENFENLSDLLNHLHPIGEYQSRLHKILANNPKRRGELFNKLRAEFPLRQQFGHIFLPETYFERFPVLDKLGFGLIGETE